MKVNYVNLTFRLSPSLLKSTHIVACLLSQLGSPDSHFLADFIKYKAERDKVACKPFKFQGGYRGQGVLVLRSVRCSNRL